MDEQKASKFVVRFTARGEDDEELRNDLRRVAEQLGVLTLTRDQYSSHGRFHPTTIHRRLGGWTAALTSAGLSAGRPDLGHNDDDWMGNIAAVWSSIGRQPTYGDMRRAGKYSPEGYAKRFGSWREAMIRFSEWVQDADRQKLEPRLSIPVNRTTGRTPGQRLRFTVLQRDRFTCRSCGRSPAVTLGVVLHVDHVVPYSQGGETTLENLQTLCQDCNLGKSDSPISSP